MPSRPLDSDVISSGVPTVASVFFPVLTDVSLTFSNMFSGMVGLGFVSKCVFYVLNRDFAGASNKIVKSVPAQVVSSL